MGAGAMYTSDCRATYEELKAKGVHFKSEPKEQFYGKLEAIITDGCGNWFSMTQPKELDIVKTRNRFVHRKFLPESDSQGVSPHKRNKILCPQTVLQIKVRIARVIILVFL